ncbi:MAG TPA: hypothetical protein VK795_01405 [Terriglobales bacterium]|nr:hypothetical protein [Terriglobales bacterium]
MGAFARDRQPALRPISHDPLTLGGIVLLLFAAGFLAGFVPSRRATNMDPMVALLHE